MAFVVADMLARLRLKPDQKSFDIANKGIEKVKNGLRDIAMLATAAVSALAVGDFLNFDDALTDLDIATDGAMGSLDGVRDKILDVSDATGVGKEEVTALAGEYVKLTGDAKGASEELDTFARVASATKSSAADIAGTAAAMSQQFGMLPSEFESGFSMAVAAGKAGAVELRQLATELPELGKLATSFAGNKGREGLARLTAMLQVVAQGTGGNASKAKTQVQGLLNELTSPTMLKKLKKLGVNVFEIDPATGKEISRNYQDIITEMSNKGLTDRQIGDLFGSVEAKNAFRTLKDSGIDTWEAITEAQLGANDIAEDFAKRQKSDSARVRKFWNGLKNDITRVIVVIVRYFGLFTAAVLAVVAAFVKLAIAQKFAAAGSVKAAAISAAAWLKSIAPVALLAAKFFAIILILNDLYSLLAGGDSYIRDWVMAGVYWLDEVLTKSIEGIKIAFANMWKGFTDGLDALSTGIKDIVEWLVKKVEWLIKKTEWVAAKIAELNPLADGGVLGDASVKIRAGESLGDAFGRGAGIDVAGALATSGAPGSTVTVGQITVTPPPGGDPAAYGEAVRTEMQKFWQGAMRETATELGR